MDKREKVLKGLEICKEESKLCFGESECGYQSVFPRCWITLAADALALLKAQEPCEDAVSRKDVINVLQSPCDMRYVNGNWHPCIGDYIEAITNLSAVAPKAQELQWTPITFRALTEEEKAEHQDWCCIIDSQTPDDGEDILVSDGKNVWADVWGNNGTECYLESDHELDGVAWMKMPTPWRKDK